MAEYAFTVDSATFLPPAAVLEALDERNPVNADFVASAISAALAGVATQADILALKANAAMLVTNNGTTTNGGWSLTRPLDAANWACVFAKGGASAPTWLDTDHGDFWLGSVA